MLSLDRKIEPTTNSVAVRDYASHSTSNEVKIDDYDAEKLTVGSFNEVPSERKPIVKKKIVIEASRGNYSELMTAFIHIISKSLSSIERDHLLAAESGELVVKCKSYLSSLIGDKTARRYIATTMLVIRNNYSVLDKAKREQLVGYLDSYYRVQDGTTTAEDALTTLYKHGIKPL